MRIAVLSRYNGQVNRGVESWCLQLCHHLALRGHDCLLLQGGPDIPTDTSYRTVPVGVTNRDFSGWRPPTNLASKVIERCYLGAVNRDVARFTAQALPHLAAFRPDVVVPTNYFWGIVAARITRSLGASQSRIVVMSHSGWSYLERDSIRVGIDGFVAQQPLIYRDAVAFARGRTQVRLIPSAVNIERFVSGPAAEISLKQPIVIVVSALDDYKRVDLAVRAVARTGMSLLLLGDGPNSAKVDCLAAELLDPDRFLHVPRVPFKDIGAYYRAADVFTLPSTPGEAFGVVILEAMAAGLPTVVSDDPVRRWIGGETEWYVDATNITEYARALDAAATRSKYRPEATAHLTRFEWPSVAAEFEQFFEDVGEIRRTAPIH